jgi:hypothetical protein
VLPAAQLTRSNRNYLHPLSADCGALLLRAHTCREASSRRLPELKINACAVQGCRECGAQIYFPRHPTTLLMTIQDQSAFELLKR